VTGELNDLVQQGSAQDTNKSFKPGAALNKTQGTHFNRSRHFYISNESTIESGTKTTPFRYRFIARWNDPKIKPASNLVYLDIILQLSAAALFFIIQLQLRQGTLRCWSNPRSAYTHIHTQQCIHTYTQECIRIHTGMHTQLNTKECIRTQGCTCTQRPKQPAVWYVFTLGLLIYGTNTHLCYNNMYDPDWSANSRPRPLSHTWQQRQPHDSPLTT